MFFMTHYVCLDNRYSTTRMLTVVPPVTMENTDDPLKIKSAGGLRTKAYYKASAENKPLITIITVVKNGVKYLEQSLLSVINQTYENIEYIIIDGCSTDGTLDIINNYDDYIDYWISEHDNGIYDAINKGIKLATGDYIAVLQSDDWYEPDIVNSIAEEILKHKLTTPNVIYSNYTIVNETYSKVSRVESTLEYWLGMTISHQSMFVSADVYTMLGGYETGYRLAADYEFFIRMVTGGVVFIGINHYGVFFRLGGNSSLSNRKSIDEAIKINSKYLGRFSRKHALFMMRIYNHLFFSSLELFFFNLLGEKRVIKTKKRIKNILDSILSCLQKRKTQ